MLLPSKIQIGFEEFKIKYEDNLILSQNKLATLYPSQDYVRVHSGLPPGVKARMIFSSVHLWVGNQVDPDLDEKQQHALCHVIYSILKDNPELVELKLLSKLHMFGDDYEVVYRDPPQNNNFASWSNVAMKMWVNPTVNKSIQLHSLFHEIYHVAYQYLDYQIEERSIDLFSWFLVQVLHQNDMCWLIEPERKDS